MSKKSEGRGKQFRCSKPMERVLLEVLVDEVKLGRDLTTLLEHF